MFLFLPLMLAMNCVSKKNYKTFPLVCIGIMTAVVISAVRMIFFYPHRIVTFSFYDNFIYLLVKEYFLPSVLLYLIFFLISKDTMEYKVNAIYPLEISFFVVYLPYTIINSSSGYLEPFTMILKPIMYSSLFLGVEYFARGIYKNATKVKKNAGFIVLYSFLIVLYIFIPAVIETLYLMNTNLLIAVALVSVYSIYPIVMAIINALKADDDKLETFSFKHKESEDVTLDVKKSFNSSATSYFDSMMKKEEKPSRSFDFSFDSKKDK